MDTQTGTDADVIVCQMTGAAVAARTGSIGSAVCLLEVRGAR